MAQVSISEAIRLSGVGRTTFYSKYINQGLISVSEYKGKKHIDTSELIRVFGELKSDNSKEAEKEITEQSEQYKNEQNEQSELVRILREQISDLKADKEFLQGQVVSLSNRLEAPSSPKKQSWLARIWYAKDDD